MAELKKCFTPVCLTALQTRAFHDRVQRAKETVDAYAQELCKLFSKAYATTTRGGSEAEKMGRTVLASQFVSGLRSELKSKVVGSEGSLEQLLAKARFEEAKRKELLNVQPPKRPTPAASGQNQNQDNSPRSDPKHGSSSSNSTRGSSESTWKCYRCGRPGHVARACPYPKPSKGQEAHGRKEPAVANVTTAKETGQEERKIEELRREQTLPKQNNEISMISGWKSPREIIGFSLSEVPGVNENFMKTRNFMKWKPMKNEKSMNIFHGVFIVS